MFYLFEDILSYLRNQKVKKAILDRKVILEIGCGSQAKLLRSLGANKKLIGIDPKLSDDLPKSDELTLIKDKIIDNIKLPDNYVDCIIMLAVIEHLDSPLKIFKESYRILKPNGILCLTTPSPWLKPILEFLGYKLKILDKELVDEHKQYFNKEKLIELSNQAGFKNCFHQYFQFGCNNFFIAYK